MRLIFDVPDYYSEGVATITLISTKVEEAALTVNVDGVDLSKSHHWKLRDDSKPEVVEDGKYYLEQELNSYIGLLFAEGYYVDFSQYDMFSDLRIKMKHNDFTLSVSLYGNDRYDVDVVRQKLESMQTFMELLDEDSEDQIQDT